MNLVLSNHPLKIILLHHIKSLREQMIMAGLQEGLDHESTLQLSQKLDEYIYLYQSYERQLSE